MSAAPPPASERVRDEWRRRVEAEYRSAAVTQHLVLWLIQIGASPDLIRAGLRIVGDELLHARLSRDVLRAASGRRAPLPPIAVDREELGLRRRDGEPLEHDVARAAVSTFCLHETVAVPLFQGLRAGCTVPVARRVLDRVLRDEVRHRDFGWTLLGWLLAGPLADPVRALVVAELPAMLDEVSACYIEAGDAGEARLDAGERAWGLMPGAKYAACARRTVERDYVPRFARLGIDARAAWEIRSTPAPPG